MIKKVYNKPELKSEAFVPQSYVAACGDSGTVYKFKCDAGGGVSGDVYLETNGTPGLQTGRGGDRYLSSYHACGSSHEADSTDEFLNGYYVINRWGTQTITPVIVWRGPNNDNTHCTAELDQSKWETAKS